MNAQDLRAALTSIGLVQRRNGGVSPSKAAKFLRVSTRTMNGWLLNGCHESTGLILELMLALHVDAEWVAWHCNRGHDDDNKPDVSR